MSLPRTRSLLNSTSNVNNSPKEGFMESPENSSDLVPLKSSTLDEISQLNHHIVNGSASKSGNNFSSSTPNSVLSDLNTLNLPSVKNGTNKHTIRGPITAKDALAHFSNLLTNYEHLEITSYPEIYFMGHRAKKIQGVIGGPNNGNYDNDQGSYIHVVHDHVAYRYEVLKVIGKGSFGQVVQAYDHKTHEYCALKMVRNEKRFHRQAQEEIRILEHLRKQDKENTMNIIHMFDNFVFRNHICITFELLSINLYELIKKNKFQGFSLQLVRRFSHSLLQCLDALYRNKIIHCDMKPENVLIKQPGRSGIKVCRLQ